MKEIKNVSYKDNNFNFLSNIPRANMNFCNKVFLLLETKILVEATNISLGAILVEKQEDFLVCVINFCSKNFFETFLHLRNNGQQLI